MRWTREHDDHLRRWVGVKTHREIGDDLGRSMRSVRNRAWRLGLVDNTIRFSKAEIRRICQWYADHEDAPLDLAALAGELGRTKTAVACVAGKMGLTSMKRPKTDAQKRALAENARLRLAFNGHPRGMAGKKHSPDARARMSAGHQRLMAEGTHPCQRPKTQETLDKMARATWERMQGQNPYSRAARGRREDLGDTFFRSRWEANYARFLNLLAARGEIDRWEYEPDTFWFEKIKRGVRSYTPDFKVWLHDGSFYYVEVKGWMDAKSKTKLRRMKKYHPKVDLRLVDAKAYRELDKTVAGAIPTWERAA